MLSFIRRLRAVQNKKFHHGASAKLNGATGEEDGTQTAAKRQSDDEDDSGNESEAAGSDTASHSMPVDEDEPEPTTAEEMEKRIEKLQKVSARFCVHGSL